MDAEEFRLVLLLSPNPRSLKLAGLVNHIVAGERFIKAYEILAEVNRKDEPTPEDSCVLDSAKERLKLLYAELRNRADLYEDN